MAERLCADQTIEAPPSLLRTCQIPEGLLGRVEDFAREEESRHQVRISFPVELFGQSFAQMVHTLFGTASLSSQIQVADIHLPTQLPEGWPGPRHGIRGIRKKTDVTGRPLVCAVLKPLGLSPEALAELAHRFALGGVDILVNCAGGAYRGRLGEIPDDAWERFFKVKPLGLIRMTRETLPHLRQSDQGRVVNISGTRGREPEAHSMMSGPINLGNPGEFTIRQLAEKVIALTGSRSKLIAKPLPQDDPRQRRPDITLATETLGWRPKVQLEEGLRQTIAYFDAFLKEGK